MLLRFSPKTPPYAEVAAYLISACAQPLKLHVDRSCSQPSLKLQDLTLTGRLSLLRYFARSNAKCKLYPEDDALLASSIDQQLNLLSGSPDNKTIDQLTGSKSQEPTIADLLLWDFCLVHQKQAEFVSKWSSIPNFKRALDLVNAAIQKEPILHKVKYEIAEQIEILTQIPMITAFECVDTPKDSKNGDLCIPIPRLKIPGNPMAIAKDLSEKFKIGGYIEKVAVIGPFLNFFISKARLGAELIPQVVQQDKEYGCNNSGYGKTGVLDFSSPNIAKPFHAGHLRGTIIGNFIINVLKSNGWNTVGINYLGDWGKQYGVLALGYERHGSEEELKKDPIRHLFDVYVKINAEAKENPEIDDAARAYFKKMEDGEEGALKLWQNFRNLSIEKYKEVYGRLNVYFDVYSGESQYSLKQVESVVNEMRESNLLKVENGAEIVDLNDHGLGAAVVVKKDGSLLYLSRDIAAAIDRYKTYKFDRMFYVVGSQQDHHFKQLFKILELMGKSWTDKCVHINFGMIKGMSTRRGNVVFLEDMLDQTRDEMHSVMKSNAEKYAKLSNPDAVADLVGISSIIIQDMSARRHKDYSFDWSRMLSFEGDTGPYLQYAHSRLCSIERTFEEYFGAPFDINKADTSLLTEPQAIALMDVLCQYPDLVKDVETSLEPCSVVGFCFDLTHRVSAAIEVLWVRGRERELAEARMALYVAARITLGNALQLLGLKPLERM